MELRTIDIGVPVRYADYGGEGPPIVLLHGLGGVHLNWMRLAPLLAQHGRVLVPDLPGFGGTPPLPERTSVGTLERAVSRFLDAVAPGGVPVTLGGNSLGGVLSMLLAAREPERVRRLMLFSPAVPHAYFEPFDAHAFIEMGTAMLPFFGPAGVQTRPARLGPERLVMEMMHFMAHDVRRIPQEVLDRHIEEARARMDRPWIGSAFSDALRSLSWRLFNRLEFAWMVGSIEAPAIVFAGERDRFVRARSIREACEMNSGFLFRLFPEVGHVPQLEVPERVMAEIDAFFRKHPIGPGKVAA